MARKLSVEIDGDSRSGRKAIDSLADEVDKAAKQLDKMEAKADAAAVKARKLAEAEERAGDKTRQLTERMVALQKEIADSGDESGDLTRKLERLQVAVKTNAHATDDYRRAASRASAEAREQARAYDRVADNARQAARAVALLAAANALPGDGGGGRGRRGGLLGLLGSLGSNALSLGGSALGAGGSALAGIGGSAAGLAGGGTGGAVAVGVGAPVALGAAIFGGAAAGGAALFGGAAAGAGLGLAGAWMGDPVKYGAMWNKAIDGIQRRWLDSSSAFGNELEGGLKVVDQVLRDLPIEKILAVSQGFVAPLAGGLGGGITAAADGFADFLSKAQPVVDIVGPALANLGHDIGDAFRIIGVGSNQGGQALGDLIGVIGYTVKAVSVMIAGFELAYGAIRDFGSGVKSNVQDILGVGASAAVGNFAKGVFGIGESTLVAGRALDDFGKSSDASATSLGGMAKAAANAAIETLGLNDAVTETRNTMLGMADANIALAQGWLDLKQELGDGAKTLNLNTQAGIDNSKSILQQVETAERLRLQQIATGGDTVDAIAAADAAYAANIEKIKQAAYAAHFNKAEVDALILSLGAIPPAKSTTITTPGMASALAQGISLGNALNNIDRTYTARINISGVAAALSQAARVAASLPGHAGGGVMPFSGPKLVGEKGPEIVWGSQGQYVSTAQQTKHVISQMRAGSSSAGGGGGSGSTLTVAPGPGAGSDPLAQLVLQSVLSGRLQLFANGQRVTARV